MHMYIYFLVWIIIYFTNIHTYTIAYSNALVRITAQLLRTTITGIYRLTLTAKNIFLRNFFMASLFTLRVFARNMLKEIAEEIIFFFHVSFRCLTWDTNPGFSFNKPTHCLLDYGDFNYKLKIVHNFQRQIGDVTRKNCRLRTVSVS